MTFIYGIRHRAKNWALIRGQYVGVLWLVIGLLGFLYVKFVQPEVEKAVLHKLQEFADPAPPGVLFMGALSISGLLALSLKYVPTTWPERTADEVSDAATNFAAISCVLFVWQSVLGSPHWQGLLVPLAMLVPAIAFCPLEPRRPRAADFGVKFTSPEENALVEGETLVRGTAKMEPPAGSEIWLVRRWGGYEHEFYPVGRILMTRNGNSFEWAVKNATVGGRPGKGDTRRFEVWLVGPDGKQLINLWNDWDKYFGTFRNNPRFKDTELLSRAIGGHTKDMLCLASRVVQRK